MCVTHTDGYQQNTDEYIAEKMKSKAKRQMDRWKDGCKPGSRKVRWAVR